MKKILPLLFVFISFAANSYAGTTCSSCKQIIFKQNKGQWNENVLFKCEMPNAYIFFCPNNFTYLLADTNDMHRLRHDLHRYYEYKPDIDPVIHLHAFRAIFENANNNCKISASDDLTEYFNYYLGSNPKNWASHVSAYHNLTYKSIYNDIDLQVYSANGNMKYDFVVKGNADASQIKILYEAVDGIRVVNNNLRIETSVGEIAEMKPYAYQTINGKRKEVKCEFVLNEKKVTYRFPDGYDKSNDLIIDPTLIFSTFSGSTADNFGYSATYDSKGEVYAAGSVFQFGQFPVTLGAFQTTWAGGLGYNNPNNQSGTGTDIGITKYDSAGTQRIY